MLKLVFLTIILYIIIQHFMDEEIEKMADTENQSETIMQNKDLVEPIPIPAPIQLAGSDIDRTKQVRSIDATRNIINQRVNNLLVSKKNDKGEKVWEFSKPEPWSKIILRENDEYPYYYHIKLKIPTLNDYEAWKQIIQNLDFNSRTGELIIPSKDEASALALANLIAINFAGQLSVDNILDKKLIQISVAKAKTHEQTQHKIREQIMENLYGKTMQPADNNFERDLALGTTSQNQAPRIDFTSESFSDTFQHFTGDNNKEDIEAYDGNDFSYL